MIRLLLINCSSDSKVHQFSSHSLYVSAGMEESVSDFESKQESKKRPKALPFILFNVFIERFCTGGVSGEGKVYELMRFVS